MSLTGSPTMECVCCGRSYQISSSQTDEDVKEDSHETSKRAESAFIDNDRHVKRRQDPQVDPSQLIAQKLVIGWTMLADVCNSEQCHGSVPLMRDKEGHVSYDYPRYEADRLLYLISVYHRQLTRVYHKCIFYAFQC